MSDKKLIVGVEKHSIAHKLHINKGDFLLKVNGEPVDDVFDYQFGAVDEHLSIEIETAKGEIRAFDIDKEYGEDLGLVFESSLMDEYHSCTNKCIFCFIDQMPKGMRDTLYFKDDDSRLSFLQGNYITLTNIKEKDIERIIRYHMEPINISVHTTDPELRCRMLNNRFAGDVLRYLDMLYEAGTTMNAQIVLCKGINDGEQLKKTISDLSKYAPVLESLSVVPVGLTKFRDGLFPLEPITAKDAAETIDIIEDFQKKLFEEHDLHFVHASDELYLLAGRELPEEERYDGYLQIENGVGMLKSLEVEFFDELDYREEEGDVLKGRNISIATGVLPAPFMNSLTADFNERFGGSTKVYPIINHFFGESITVSGLVCGCDIIEQLKGKDLGEELLIPVNMMRFGETYFLDDVTITELEKELNIKVTIVPNNGEALVQALLGEEITDYGRQIYEQADSCSSWEA
ncbi:MAG: DUF512 domain-containing protein [Parasporobacterium sp.]|nr:DUF512 domain-containing protein [Parasporobacterium sp.]